MTATTDTVSARTCAPDSMPRTAGGYVLGLVVHVSLLLVVCTMVVFLASRYRVRVDLTADDLYTLTASTRHVLDRVEDRLRIEAYFSPDEELASVNRDGRRTLRNVLDEFEQRGRGRVVVQYFDPESDVELRKKAERLGIKPQQVQDMEGSTLSTKLVWQGLRLLYGGARQKVVPILGFTDQPWQYEAALTPMIKALTVGEKPRIGVIQWAGTPAATPGIGRQEQPRGYDRLLSIPELTDRYEFVSVDLSLGQLVPEQLETLVLFRPKDLDDRRKYAIDQFLMRGGQLVLFADSDDVSLGQARLLTTQEVSWDAAGASGSFLEQLAFYGAVVRDRFLVDSASPAVPFGVPISVQVQGRVVNTLQPLEYYPYWYVPAAGDWSEKAEVFAQRADGSVDQALMDAYRQQFRPGVDPERAKGLTPPAFFWPCAVDLAEVLPDGVEGHVLMRSSPRSALQTPPRSVDPVGKDAQRIQQVFNRFATEISQLLRGEPPRQHGLMIELGGRFRSWFANRAIPPRPGAGTPAAEEREPVDPLAGPVEVDPLKDGDDIVGPELPGPAGDPESDAKDADPAPLLEAVAGARLVVVADATFLRDDLVGGEYQQVGGPTSQLGPMFFANLLDWLAADRDLYELRTRGFGVDRRLALLDDRALESIPKEKLQQELDRHAGWIRFWNVSLPIALLVGVGLLVSVTRRSAKRRFVARSEG